MERSLRSGMPLRVGNGMAAGPTYEDHDAVRLAALIAPVPPTAPHDTEKGPFCPLQNTIPKVPPIAFFIRGLTRR